MKIHNSSHWLTPNGRRGTVIRASSLIIILIAIASFISGVITYEFRENGYYPTLFIGFCAGCSIVCLISALGAYLKHSEIEHYFPRTSARFTGLKAISISPDDSHMKLRYEVLLLSSYTHQDQEQSGESHISMETWDSEDHARKYIESRLDINGFWEIAINPQKPTETYLLPLSPELNNQIWKPAIIFSRIFIIAGICVFYLTSQK